MKTDYIKEIKIDDLDRLCIFPKKEEFTLIWRTATQVHWDIENSFLYSSKPTEWSYFDWCRHIINIAKDCGCELLLTEDTFWINISNSLKQQIVLNN